MLLYIVDTLRSDGLGAYGNTAAITPHFDAFGESGVVFENAFANAPWTRASVTSLLTGLYPWRHGTQGRKSRLSKEIANLAGQLGERGYTTLLVSANPNVGSAFGFDDVFDSVVDLYRRREPGWVKGHELVTESDVVTAKAIEWLEQVEPPFLLVMLPVDPHAPYTPPSRFDPQNVEPDDPTITGVFTSLERTDLGERDKARIRELYQAEIAQNDESFGVLINALNQRGLLENTIAVVTSDHGEEFWEEEERRGHGKSLSDDVLQVPLMISHPANARLQAGTRISLPIELVDVLPSVLDLAGLPIPERLDGRSLFTAVPPRVAKNEREGRILLSSLEMDSYDMRSARRHPWRLVWNRALGEYKLYELGAEVGQGASPQDTQEANRKLRLALEWAAADAQQGVAAPKTDVLPEDVEQSLRALGYIE